MRVIGNTLTARLLLQDLLANEVAVEWYGPPEAPAALALDLTLLPGPTLSLAQHSRNRWQALAQELPFPVLNSLTMLDLATTPGRAVKLREEALLDALAGEPCEYLDTTPSGFHPRLVQGARRLAPAPQVAETLWADLTAQLAAAGVPLQPLPTEADEAWLLNAPTTLTDMALAARWLPQLYLQPLRVHRLQWPLPQPLPLPEAPLLAVHRMPRGHTWLHLTAQQLTLWYDGLNDPRQRTAEAAADDATVVALAQHAAQVLPLLGRLAAPTPAVAQATTVFVLADGLPLVGPLAVDSPLWLLGGMGVREALYAPALVERLLELWRVEEYVQSPLLPARFAHVGPQALRVPESLMFTEPTPAAPAEPTVVRPAAQMAPETEVKRATEVRMVGKEVVSGGGTMLLAKPDKAKP
jgi:hypothetical protein